MRVLAALAYAQIAGDIAIIYGGAGVGKTSAGRHYGQTSPKRVDRDDDAGDGERGAGASRRSRSRSGS